MNMLLKALQVTRGNTRSRGDGTRRMSESVNVQYVGFEAKALVRTYSFRVQHAVSGTREFTLTILNEAFSSRRASFQDAPNICSAKLHRELAAHANNPPKTHYRISELDLDAHRDSHASRSSSGIYPRKPRPRL
jgi:hypothetical protein